MRRPQEPRGELGRLAAALCDGDITPEDAKRLEQLASRSPDALRYLVQYLHLDAELHWGAALSARRSTPTPIELPQKRDLADNVPGRSAVERGRGRSRRQWTGIAAAIAIAVFAGVCGVLLLGRVTQRATTRAPVAVGTLVRAVDAHWSEDTAVVPEGSAMVADQDLHLREGLVEIHFLSGARAILHGPARFRLQTARRGFLESGSLTAHVPAPAKGFTIHTPTARIVDLGTEIGVSVHRGASEVHVFTGKVEVRPASEDGSPATHRELAAGQALRLSLRPNGDPEIREIPVERGRFVRTMPARNSVEKLRRVVAAHPRLIHHYTFEGRTRGDKCRDKQGALDLTEILMLDGTDGGDLYELAPGFDGASNAVRPYRSRESGNTVGVGLESAGRFIPPPQMTVELLLRLEESSGSTEELIAAAVAMPSHDRSVAFMGVAVDRGRLSLCMPQDASASLDLPQFVPGGWYYVAASLESESGRTRVNCYVADLSHEASVLRQAVKDVNLEATPSPGRLGIGKGYDASLKAAYPWPGALDEIAIYGAVLGPDELQEHVDLLTGKGP